MVDNNCIIEGNVKFRDGKKVSFIQSLIRFFNLYHQTMSDQIFFYYR